MFNLRSTRWGVKALVGAAIAALLASALSVLPASSAFAADPPAPALPQTVSADVLPTPQINGVVWRVAVAGNVAYAVGQFTKARPSGSPAGSNEVVRNNAMAFDVTTGAILPWNPNLNAQGRAVQVSPEGSKLYVGGDFTTVSGQSQNKVAAFNLPSGTMDTTFRPGAAGAVRSLAISNSTVYVGGSFGSAGGQTRSSLAAFTRATGALLPWAPTSDSIVEAMVASPDGSRVVIGGRFQNLNGAPKVGIGAVDGVTGASQTWTSRPIPTKSGSSSSWVTDLVIDRGVIYGTANGEGGHWFDGRFAASFSNGDLIWLDNCYGATYGAAVIGDVMYHVSHSHDCASVGTFSDSNPQVWHRALADTTFATGTDQAPPGSNMNYSGQPIPTQLNWYPVVNAGTFTGIFQGGWSLATNGNYLVMGGEFTTVNGSSQQGLATFAKRTIAANKVGPVYSASTKPSVRSLSTGTARVAFTGTSDYDDATLTYQVLRDNSLTPIYSADVKSPFWAIPQMGFIDTGLTPGSSHTYRINIKDPWGNSYIGPRSDAVTISTTTASAYAQKVVADGAMNYWPLNEPSGSVVYDNAAFSDADAGSGVARGASGAIPGDAASTFDGTANGLFSTRAPITGPNVFTTETWIKTTSTSGGKIIGFGASRTGDSGSYDRHVYMDNSGRITFGVYPNGVATVQSSPGYNDGAWHLITASLGASGMTLYIDGVRVAQRADVTVGQGYSGYWRVGGDNINGWPNTGSSEYFAGTIDDVAIYPTELSRGTVLSHYTASGRTSTIPPAPSDAYGQAVYQDEPDLYWRLDDQSGTTTQDSGYTSNPGLISGTVTKNQAGALSSGSSFGFNGQDALVAASKSVTNPLVYSLEAWFKTTTTQGGKIIGFGDRQTGTSGSYDRHVYMQDDGKLVFGTYTGQLNTATSANAYNDGHWHHVVATQSGAGMRLYVDASVVATNAQTSAQNYTGYWRIGGDTTWGSSSAFFNGQLDEAAVYSTALSGARIRAHYEAAMGPIPNTPPSAAFAVSADNLTLSFDASSSSDPDGQVVGYAWDFGDGTTASGVAQSHSYATSGQYTVSLTVTDDNAATNTVSHLVYPLTAVTTPSDTYGSAIAATHPSIYWRLNEPGGTVAQDSSLSGNTGRVSGGMTFGAPGVLASTGTAIHFDGQDGVIASQTPVTDPRNFSLEIWFMTTTSQGGKLIGFGDQQTGTSSNYDRHVYMNSDGTLAFGVWTGAPSLATSTKAYNDGIWHHMVATQSTTDGLVLYVDGESVGTNPETTAQPYTGYWRIGGDNTWGGGTFFNGYLDEAAVYNSVLTGTQVRNHYEIVRPPAANVDPIASFTSTVTGAHATFDASASTDSDGSIVGYAWNFGDGQTATGITAQHDYAADGTYTVTLTVTDNRGGVNSVSHTVTANAPNVNPVAAFTMTASGLSVSYDASTSTDSDGTISTYAWDFGDGGTAATKTATHTYAAAGTYNAILTVTDNEGGTNAVTHAVTVAVNAAPVAAFSASATGLTVAFNGSASTDSDGTITAYNWAFGDTQTATGATVSHAFAAAGTYAVTLTVTDNGGATNAVTQNVTVVAPPTYASDAFERTVTNGFGTADVGGAWTTLSSKSNFSVSSGLGRILMPGPGSGPSIYLNSVSSTDTEVKVTVGIDKVATGGGVTASLIGRGTANGDYRAQLKFLANGTVSAGLYRATSAGVLTALGTDSVIPGLSYSVGDALAIRLQVSGTSPTTLNLKVWKTGTGEPALWLKTGTDSTVGIQAAGRVGLFAYLSSTSTNAPLVTLWNDLWVGALGTP